MNPAKFLDGVCAAIDKRPPSPTGKWHITWHVDTFAVVPTDIGRHLETIFGTFTHDELLNGLTSRQWDTLSARIARFLTQKGLL